LQLVGLCLRAPASEGGMIRWFRTVPAAWIHRACPARGSSIRAYPVITHTHYM